ncbi:MAG: type II toxin-antitoxin system prevent-host-death family antitoxin [Bifidobacteriaceae bacterium]|jgi:prevent-host-death family protein|nr:type II toxin-antitoxin system prevent-host-death family antitoxin [Bifidobacteriaceae bacterium]
MRSVGIRELRQNPAGAIAAARMGEEVIITDRGTEVAQIIPLPATRRDRMIAAGRLRPAPRDYRAFGPPEVLPEGQRSPSERLAEMRDAERY